MVKVNLDYNPYTMDFKAKFNGKEPHVNSLVEKYEHIPLQTWIKDIPHILYDEMNGYDFDLEFVGPDLEYDDLVTSFREKNISDKDVRCSHVKTLECRKDKLQEMSKLNEWLDTNINSRLDLPTFKIENQDIFDNSHSLIIIGDSGLGEFKFDNAAVSIEIISDIQELDKTELQDTPIVIDAEIMSIQDFQNTLLTIIKDNPEVSEKQFFVFIRSNSRMDMYVRLLVDIGFKDAHIINRLENPELLKYFEYYPISNYIREYLCTLRKKVNELKDALDVEREESEKANGEVMSQIMMIEEHISKIKDAIIELDNINKTSVTPSWDFTKNKMLEKISTWKIKKTKITNTDEAVKLAYQFEEEVKLQWDKFIEIVKGITAENKNIIMEKCTSLYDEATKSKSPKYPNNPSFDSYKRSFDGLREQLLKIKDESYEKPKDNLINAFLKEIDVTNIKSKDAVLVITYSCQKWREYVEQLATPIIDRIIEERNKEIQEYCNNVSLDFMDKLIKLLDEREGDKENFSKRLSSDIQLLQKDIDWLSALNEKLETIERS